MKTRCSLIGWFLILIGLVVSTIGNRLEEHNKKLFAEVEHHERYMNDTNRRASRASTPEQALKIYAEKNLNFDREYAAAFLAVQQEAFSGDFIYGLYSFGGSSFILGIIMLIVAFVLPKTTTIPVVSVEQAIDKRMVELEAERRLNEQEQRRQENERKQAEENERLRRQREEEERKKQIREEIEHRKETRKNRERSIPLFQEAVKHYSARHFGSALIYCNKSITLFPHANSFLLRAWIFEALEKDQKVIGDCTEALRLDSKLNDAQFVRGKALMRRMENAQLYFNRKWWSNAINDFCAIPAPSENYTEARKMLAVLHSNEFKSSCRIKACLTLTLIASGVAFTCIVIYFVVKNVFFV